MCLITKFKLNSVIKGIVILSFSCERLRPHCSSDAENDPTFLSIKFKLRSLINYLSS